MNRLKTIATNICRAVLAVTFIFSGYVKAIDPLGTQYKIRDYLTALSIGDYVPDWLTLGSSVALAALEFALGIFILFAIRRRFTTRVILAFMAVMTLITVWIAIANPVSDCGCFGDAITLTNVQTLLKNVVLTACAVVVCRCRERMFRFVSENNQWIAVNYTVIYIVATSIYSLYLLPRFDFRPYHVGANIREGMEIPEGAKMPRYENTFVMEKNGERREFTLDNYPDSTWTFVERKSELVEEGYVPPIHDFTITDNATGDDITQQILDDKGYTFLLVSPHLESADDTNFGDIDQLYEYCQAQGVPFYCLTASGEDAIQHWRDITGAEYPFCMSDETTLKTVI
uniref:BT_3928 family protein n=1 Tax=Prevotella sp. TaxID=59823 RepID=UPI0040282461